MTTAKHQVAGGKERRNRLTLTPRNLAGGGEDFSHAARANRICAPIEP